MNSKIKGSLTMGVFGDIGKVVDHGLDALAGVDFLHAGGMSEHSSNDLVQQITAESFFDAVRGCDSSSAVSSNINLDCDPGDGFDQNESCQLCRAVIADAIQKEAELEKEAEMLSEGSYKAKTASAEVISALNGEEPTTDPCRYVCISCIAENNKQENFLTMSTTCQFDDSFDDRFQTAMQDKLSAQLTDHNTTLEKVGIQGIDITQASVDIKNRVASRFTATVRQFARNSVTQFQNMTFESGSQGIVATKNSQVFSTEVVLNVFNSRFASQSVYNQSDLTARVTQFSQQTNELNSLRASLATVINSVGDLWSDIKGRLMTIVAGVLLILVLAMGAVLFFMKQKPS